MHWTRPPHPKAIASGSRLHVCEHIDQISPVAVLSTNCLHAGPVQHDTYLTCCCRPAQTSWQQATLRNPSRQTALAEWQSGLQITRSTRCGAWPQPPVSPAWTLPPRRLACWLWGYDGSLTVFDLKSKQVSFLADSGGSCLGRRSKLPCTAALCSPVGASHAATWALLSKSTVDRSTTDLLLHRQRPMAAAQPASKHWGPLWLAASVLLLTSDRPAGSTTARRAAVDIHATGCSDAVDSEKLQEISYLE